MHGRKQLIGWLTTCLVLMLAPIAQAARPAIPTAEPEKCLVCHGREPAETGAIREEPAAPYVDTATLSASAHPDTDCSECHGEFASGQHPRPRFRDGQQQKLRYALLCRECHSDAEIALKPIHAHLLEHAQDGGAPACTDCHGAHNVAPISGGKVLQSERRYCQGCHEHPITTVLRSGEALMLRTDLTVLDASEHHMLSCSDCHFGFSSQEHPERNFRTLRDYAIASADSCKRCHFDKHTRTLESIHYAILNQGNQSAPVCTDCHGAHGIAAAGKDRAFSAKRCKQCHGEVYETYAQSVHGNALINERNQDVPVCIDCHRAHDIVNPLTLEFHDGIPDTCANCHSNKRIMGKYGLSTDVVKTYLSDFHGVTLNFYRKQKEVLLKPGRPIAVCTDCHGTHDIASDADTDPLIVKGRLLNRCQKCHPEATENFPDAWLSHYEPTLEKAPIVYLVNLSYRIFLPVMVVGLILQILLHIWRYAVNR
jgi:hypothetical protein